MRSCSATGGAASMPRKRAISWEMIRSITPAPMPACIIAVASTFTWISGAWPASSRAWNSGGMSTTKVVRPVSIRRSTSASGIARGGLNRGGSSASRIRADSGEPSSSTISTEALRSSCATPVAWE